MTNHESIFLNIPLNHARELKLSGRIPREDYWKIVRSKLEVLIEIQSALDRQNLKLNVSPSSIQLEIPLLGYESTIKMTLNVKDIRSVPFSVLADGPYEEFLGRILMRLSEQSSDFLDIGSNMGYYSLAVSKINPKIKVQAFEPQPNVFSTLTENISLNNLHRSIDAHNFGLGMKESNLTMFIPKFTGTGGASFANLHETEGLPQEVDVRVKTLDGFLGSSTLPELMKIDVEGYEFEVIFGGMDMISRSKPTIIIELLRKWMKPFNRHPQDVVKLLTSVGYRVFAISEKSLLPLVKIDENTAETNFVFVHPNRTTHLATLEKYI